MMMGTLLVLCLALCGTSSLLLCIGISLWRCRLRRRTTSNGNIVIAFYHPYCSSGGGGERVLWKIIEVLSRFSVHTVIYTVDVETPTYRTDLLRHVQDRFSLSIPLDKMELSFVHLPQHKHLLQPAGSFSLLQESLGAMRLAYHGLSSQGGQPRPSLFIDTTGAAFSFLPAYFLFGCRVMAYVHYPTISTDMLQLVWDTRYGESRTISLRSYAKLVYYLLFAGLYGAIGSCATTLVLVNSTWTYRHIRSLWRGARDVRIVYPPCFNTPTSTAKHLSQPKPSTIVSVGQFRPEKDHALQIRAFSRLQELHPEVECRLVLLGSCRNQEDAARLDALREMAASNAAVEFVVNAPSSVLQDWLYHNAHVGLHTMWNEHFGIGIVEMMAAGLLVVAHNSGGPQTDIVVHGETGFLAATVDEYANALYQALTMPSTERIAMQRKAQTSSERFTDQVFEEAILKAIGDLHVIDR